METQLVSDEVKLKISFQPHENCVVQALLPANERSHYDAV